MRLALFLHAVIVLTARLALIHPLFGELTRLDLRQHLLHLSLRCIGHDPRPTSQIAVLGRVRNRIAHTGNALFVHQVDDELHLMQAFEVRHFRRVTCLDQRLESGLHQTGETTTQHNLLTEQVSLSLFCERRLDHTSASPTDGISV